MNEFIKRLLLICWICSLGGRGTYSLVAQPLQLPQPHILTDQQGLPQRFIPSIVQDQQGFIWMATRDGLCRYDGSRFKVFQPQSGSQTSLSFSAIHSLRLDARGRIWILSEQSDVDVFEPQSETFTNFSKMPVFQQAFGQYHINALYIDRQDRLWISIQAKYKSKDKLLGRGLVCLNTHTYQFHWFRHQDTHPHSLSSDQVKAIVQDTKGIVWVATAVGIDEFDPAAKQFIHRPPLRLAQAGLPQLEIRSFVSGPKNELLIGSLTGFGIINATRSELHHYTLPLQGFDWHGVRFATDSRGGVFLANRDYLYYYVPGKDCNG